MFTVLPGTQEGLQSYDKPNDMRNHHDELLKLLVLKLFYFKKKYHNI